MVLGLWGCKQPGEVVVTPEDDDLQFTPVAESDTVRYLPSFDTSGVLLPQDHDRFGGFALVSSIRYRGVAREDSFAASALYFADLTRPESLGNRIVGYYGFDLGPVALNGSPMFRLPHNVMGNAAGWRYLQGLTNAYLPGALYVWSAGSSPFGPIQLSIVSPPSLRVLSPAAGEVIRRDQDIALRWTGEGDIAIVLSILGPSGRRHPILHARPPVNRGHGLLRARMLRMLPSTRSYVVSFVLFNRQETMVGTYPNPVLVQAASVIHVFVHLR